MASAAIRSYRCILNVGRRYQSVLSLRKSTNNRETCMRKYATEVAMPSLSPTMEEGTIVKWYKKEGETISPGDVLCDIQTDKAVVGFDVEDEGILAKIIKPDNSKDIKVGTLIAMIADTDEDWKNIEVPTGSTAGGQTDKSSTTEASSPAISQTTVNHSATLGPSVRRLMEEYSLTITDISHSGPHGRVIKSDILSHIKRLNLSKVAIKSPPQIPETKPVSVTPSPVIATGDTTKAGPTRPTVIPADGEPYVDIPNTNIRKVIAQRLSESKQTIPHSYATISSDVTAAVNLRKKLLRQGVKVSMNDFIIKAAGVSLQRVPRVNSTYQGDTHQKLSTVDISVAVATDKGLITPIVRNVGELDVDEISQSIKNLAAKARDGKLKPEEYQGGSFSVSNLGMFGITEFSAVINPPQTAILAIGTSQLALNNEGSPCTEMRVTLSYDNRVIDEVEASKFLETFRDTMENPATMTVGLSTKEDKEAYSF